MLIGEMDNSFNSYVRGKNATYKFVTKRCSRKYFHNFCIT